MYSYFRIFYTFVKMFSDPVCFVIIINIQKNFNRIANIPNIFYDFLFFTITCPKLFLCINLQDVM